MSSCLGGELIAIVIIIAAVIDGVVAVIVSIVVTLYALASLPCIQA